MSYQLNIIKRLLKKDFFKLFIYFGIILFFLLVIAFFSGVTIDLSFFNMLLGKVNYVEINLYGLLWHFFQIFITIYISYKICYYEDENSLEFIILRANYIDLFIKKFIILTSFILIIRSIVYILINTILLKYHFASFNNYIQIIIIYLIISYTIFILFVLSKIFKNK